MYKLSDKPSKEQIAEYQKLAKKADARMRGIEELRHRKHFKNVDKFAYARAIKSIEKYRGEGKKRFNYTPQTIGELNRMKKAMELFVDAPTSNFSGIMKIYKKRTDTINSKKEVIDKGIHFTWQELANFYESDYADQLDSSLDSNTVLKTIAKIRGTSQTEIEKLEEYQKNPQILRVGDDLENEAISIALKENGITLSDLKGIL